MKTIRIIAFGALLIAALSVIQKMGYFYMHAAVIDITNAVDAGFRMAIFLFATAWVLTLVKKRRCAMLLTSIALLVPCLMAAYNIIAIWFEDDTLLLNVWITFCIIAGIILYINFVWRRWWLPLRRAVIKEWGFVDEI